MTSPTPEVVEKMIQRLRAPAYWMSGSSDGHEGENDAPREAADLLEALGYSRLVEERPLRLCGYCRTWNAKPCGNQCYWSPTDPTLEKVEAAAALQPTQASEGDT